jgi:hypothetical protein
MVAFCCFFVRWAHPPPRGEKEGKRTVEKAPERSSIVLVPLSSGEVRRERSDIQVIC